MAHKETPAFAGAVSTSGGVTTQYKPNKNAMQRAGAAITAALVCLPDRPSPGQHAADLAVILRCRLDAGALLWLAGATCFALDPDTLDVLITAAQRDRDLPWPFTSFGRRHRPPPLTKIEKRRADAISFDDNPRETLAAAWAGATDRDRRDLVARATGRVEA